MLSELKERILQYKPAKGGKGSICVIGGSFEYSGAPYFTAISALRTGCDLSFIISDKNSANVIKTYSPELIVFGILDLNNPVTSLNFPIQIINRMSVLVVGPGLSRNENIISQVMDLLFNLKNKDLPIIFDGDGIFLFKLHNNTLCELFKRIILTPNLNEFKLLQNIDLSKDVLTVYLKGQKDVILRKFESFELNDPGTPRRCGGIGDILVGVISSIISMHGETDLISSDKIIQCLIISGKIVRKASEQAFVQKGRSMSAPDVIQNIGNSFEQLFE